MMVVSFWSDGSGQTEETQIRLFLMGAVLSGSSCLHFSDFRLQLCNFRVPTFMIDGANQVKRLSLF